MDFEYNDEQRMLADSVGRWLESSYRFEDFRRYAADHRQAQTNWGQLAELGMLSLNIAEADGGLGGGAVETLLIMQAFGRALVVDPYVGTAVIAVALLNAEPDVAPAQRTPAADRHGIATGRVGGARAGQPLRPRARLDHSQTLRQSVRSVRKKGRGNAWRLGG